MPISIGYQFKYPYCGLETRLYHEMHGYVSHVAPMHISPFVQYCPVDEGGCDKLVVVKLSPSVDVVTLKIEGEGTWHCSGEKSKEDEEPQRELDTRQLDLFQKSSPDASESEQNAPMAHPV